MALPRWLRLNAVVEWQHKKAESQRSTLLGITHHMQWLFVTRMGGKGWKDIIDSPAIRMHAHCVDLWKHPKSVHNEELGLRVWILLDCKMMSMYPGVSKFICSLTPSLLPLSCVVHAPPTDFSCEGEQSQWEMKFPATTPPGPWMYSLPYFVHPMECSSYTQKHLWIPYTQRNIAISHQKTITQWRVI